MANIFESIFHFEKRELNRYMKEADRVISFEKEIAALSDDELRAKTKHFQEYLKGSANDEEMDRRLEEIKYEAFAVCREGAKRSLKQFPYKVQIVGSLVLNGGNIAEMRTGEGKTLTATMAVYLNALTGRGVHVVTVNEYLASRDAEWMGNVYRFLGLTVGVNLSTKTAAEKREAYLCDITYTTNSELGFDYLRDNMAQSLDGRVLRGLKFCVIDEADSILIDESRTPLIISGGQRSSASQYQVADRFVKLLKPEKDFTIDIKDKTCNLTDSGNDKAEKMFGVPNLYDPQYADLVHRIHQALKANYIMMRDVEYMVDSENQIQLIDQFTGRIMKGREYNDGLQQAIQAKEGVEIKQETTVLATITYQNFFRLYKKVSGMTGTAKTEEEEFEKIYNMRVIVIPTNRPIQRVDDNDIIYGTHEGKLRGLVEEVQKRHATGQPILIGTVSVESNEEISRLLTEAHVPHEVLNAKNQAREAEIISHAGEKGAVTLATNMAGRGTDIKLTDDVKALGGLCVLGTERHESRRIDNQLRGRSGRQGDPGYSRFFVSFDDDLMKRFTNDEARERMKKILGDEHLENKMIQNMVTNAQKQIEGKNFDIRKNLLDYDDVLAKQRQIIYDRRDRIMLSGDIEDLIHDFFLDAGKFLAKKSTVPGRDEDLISAELLGKTIMPAFLPEGSMPEKTLKAYDEATVEEGGEDLGEFLYMEYLKKRKTWPKEVADRVERSITLSVIDRNWTKHIDAMTHLREGIGLRSYAQTNPLQDYVNEGYDMFREMNQTIAVDSVFNFMNARLRTSTPEQEQPKPEPKVIEAKPEEKKAAKEEPKEIAEPKKEEVQPQPEPKPQPAPAPASDPNNAAILHVGTAAPQKFEYVARPEEDDNKPMNLDEAKQITRLMLEKNITREQVIEATQRDPMDFHLLCKDAKAIIAYLQGDNSKEMPVNPIQTQPRSKSMKNLVELKQGAYELGKSVQSLGDSLDLPKINAEIEALTAEQNEEGFWNDQNKAKTVSSRLASLVSKKEAYLKCANVYRDIQDMLPEVSESDKDMMELLDSMETDLKEDCSNLQHKLLFSGPYDALNCTLDIHPGAGGTEAHDWASMLMRMYGRWAERNNFKVQVIDIEEGEEAGIKSVTLKVSGQDAYGFLKSEKGVHRLVRISPFDAAARRHTSFASVNVIPEFGAVSDIVIDPKDLRVDTYRSGGAGGQNVNKVSSAVRITHLPTGIVVQCQIERSQLMNKATCMSMLTDLLMQRKLEERERQLKSIQGEQKNIEWGSQIRSYVFQPYTMVKDHRTGYETGDINGVMDGDINQFLFSYLEMESRKDAKNVD